MIYIFLAWNLFANPGIEDGKKLFTIGEQLYEQGKYQLAADTLAVSASIFDQLNQPLDRVRSANLQAECFANLGLCDKADKLLQESLFTISSQPGDNRGLLADTYYYLSRYTGGCARKFDEALKLMDKSTVLKKESGKHDNTSIALNYTFIGYMYNSKGKYDSALAFLEEALSLHVKYGPDDAVEGSTTLFNIAASYEGKSDLAKALNFNLRALEMRQRQLGDLHATTSNSINSVGRVYRKLGDPDRALDYYKKALEIRKATLGPTHPNVAASYYEIGNLYGTVSNYNAALEYVQQGNRILEANKQVANDVLPTYLAYEGKMYGLIGDHVNAKASIEKGIKVAEKELPATHPYRGIVYNMAAEYYGDNADIKNQKIFANKAIALYRAAYGEGSEREGDVVAKLAATYLKLGDVDEAMKLYNEALRVYTAKLGTQNPKRANIFMGIGEGYFMLSNHVKAIAAYDSAEAIASNGDNKPLQLKVYTGEARMHDKMGTLLSSRAFYKRALELIGDISQGYNNEGARIQLEKDRRELYARAVNVAWRIYNSDADSTSLNNAFDLIEKSKATLLSENIRDQYAKTVAGVPDTLANKERDLRIQLTYYNNARYQVRKNKDIDNAIALDKITFELERQLEKLKSDLEKNYPEYYKLKYSGTSTNLAELQRQTPPSTTIVEYFATDSAIYSFVITHDDAKLSMQEIDDDFRNAFATYQKCLTDLDFILSDQYSDTLYSASAYKLASLLMIPAPATTAQKLIVIPDDFLAQVNFGTLKTDNSYLNNKYVISYAYSATSINDTRKHKNSIDNFAGFAPSYDNIDYTLLDTTAHPMTALVMRSGNLPLPGAAEEVNLISDLMNGKSWLNEEATETNFKKYSSSYNVLHLAMHSLLNAEEPRYSELLFNHHNDNDNDGYLSIAEIYNLDLNAQLVVLSSCSSGYGKIQHGEGPISLSRAFSYAGCPSVVMSLWKVPDQVTTSIMHSFYENLKDGSSKDEALRAAQLKFVEENKDPLYRHPYYWAGFVVIGDTAPLQSKSYMLYYLGGIILAAGILIYTRRK